MLSAASSLSNGPLLIDFDDLYSSEGTRSRKESCTSIDDTSETKSCLLDDEVYVKSNYVTLDESHSVTVIAGTSPVPPFQIPSSAPKPAVNQAFEDQERECRQRNAAIKQFFVGDKIKMAIPRPPSPSHEVTENINQWHVFAAKSSLQGNAVSSVESSRRFSAVGRTFEKSGKVTTCGKQQKTNRKSGNVSRGNHHAQFAGMFPNDNQNWTPQGLQVAEGRKNSTYQYRYNKALHAQMHFSYHLPDRPPQSRHSYSTPNSGVRVRPDFEATVSRTEQTDDLIDISV